MQKYAVIDHQGYIVGMRILSGVIPEKANMIPVDQNFNGINKKWNGSEWENYTPPEPEPDPPTQLDRIEAAVNQSWTEIANSAVDAYTLELMESGVL